MKKTVFFCLFVVMLAAAWGEQGFMTNDKERIRAPAPGPNADQQLEAPVIAQMPTAPVMAAPERVRHIPGMIGASETAEPNAGATPIQIWHQRQRLDAESAQTLAELEKIRQTAQGEGAVLTAAAVGKLMVNEQLASVRRRQEFATLQRQIQGTQIGPTIKDLGGTGGAVPNTLVQQQDQSQSVIQDLPPRSVGQF
jgi:xanthine dehydrogenase iron-sulfur cluster and FAD-binding subunit A